MWPFDGSGMRPRVEWMNQTDDRILELLDESDLILTPAVMARNLDYTRNWVSRRVGKLESAGLVEPIDSGYYRISDRGRAYLAGDLDADELE
jgi:Mn-dependent DtxR family transcriptional regulator